MIKEKNQSRLANLILYVVMLLANLRALVFVFLFPDLSKPLSLAWIEILLWLFAALGVVYLLYRDEQISSYLELWRRNWFLALFLAVAVLSLLWSVAPLATLFRVLELFFATFIAVYFGLRFFPERLMDSLFWFGAVLFMLSIALVYAAPPTGTMYWAPFNGVWRGMYWHRNHLASIAALLNAVYLIRLLSAIQARKSNGLLDAFFYLFSLIVIYFSRSATGYILLIVLNGFVLGAWIWLRIYDRLKRWHYLFFLGLGIIAAVLILSNLDFVFGLFNRSSSMTGRLPLWNYLLTVANERFWAGHGFGAVWTLDAFRDAAMRSAGWGSQPLIADNGFLDIFLHLGIIGLIILTGVLILLGVRGTRYALRQKSLSGFFPLLVLVYALFGNLSFSLFAETEVFVWFLIVTSLVMASPAFEKQVAQE